VFSEVAAADSEGVRHSSGVPKTHVAAGQLPPSVAQPPAGEAVAPREDFSFLAHGEHFTPGGAVQTLKISNDDADVRAPAHDSTPEADGFTPAAARVPRAAGSGQPSAVGSHVADGLAASDTNGCGGSAEGGWVSVSAFSGQSPAGGLQRDADDGDCAFEAASWPLQGQPTSSGGVSMPVSRSAGAGMGPGTEADAGLPSLLQPGLYNVPSAGDGLVDSILLGSPTRASPAALPSASSPGFVHGIPRLSSGTAGGRSPFAAGALNGAGLAAAASFGAAPSGGGSPFSAGNLSAAGLAAAGSSGAAPYGLSAGSSVLSSASAPSRQPSRQPVAIGPARVPVATAQGLPAGHMLPAGAATDNARVSSGNAAHVPSSTAAASSVTPPVADRAAASHVTAADGGRDAAVRAGSTGGGLATGGLAALHGVTGTVATTNAQVRCSSAADLYANGAAAGSVSSPVASSSTARHLVAAEGGQGAAAHGIGNEDGVATSGDAAPHGVAGHAAGTQLHSSVLAAPGALRRDTDARASEPSQMNSAVSADFPAELQQQVRLCGRSLVDLLRLLHA